jgi:hypothetical protein
MRKVLAFFVHLPSKATGEEAWLLPRPIDARQDREF